MSCAERPDCSETAFWINLTVPQPLPSSCYCEELSILWQTRKFIRSAREAGLINSVNTETRRKSERTKVASNEIVYLHFQTGNGGIVLDVSAEGLGFQAADPLQADESLSFRLSVPGFPEINLSGQIVWLDSTRKRGGMHLRVPAESVAMFQQWLRKYVESAAESDEIPASARRNQPTAVARQPASGLGTENRTPPAPQAPKSAETRPPDRALAPEPEPLRTNQPPAQNPFVRRTDSILGTRGPIFVSEWEVPPEPSHTGRNILVACLIIGLCLVVAGGSYYVAGKHAVGNMLVNLGQQIGGANSRAGASTPQSANSSPESSAGATAPNTPPPLQQTASVSNPASVASPETVPNAPQAPATTLPRLQEDANTTNMSTASQAATGQEGNANPISTGSGASAAKSPRSDLHNGTLDAAAPGLDVSPQTNSHPATPKQPPQHPTAPVDDGGAELDQALRYLQSPGSQDTAVAEALLWSAIGKGNTQADLVLGDLYMRGQGAVPRNCRQAEVLLHAALVADVPGAASKMDELETYGCH